jgi:hypothetical protein
MIEDLSGEILNTLNINFLFSLGVSKIILKPVKPVFSFIAEEIFALAY